MALQQDPLLESN